MSPVTGQGPRPCLVFHWETYSERVVGCCSPGPGTGICCGGGDMSHVGSFLHIPCGQCGRAVVGGTVGRGEEDWGGGTGKGDEEEDGECESRS